MRRSKQLRYLNSCWQLQQDGKRSLHVLLSTNHLRGGALSVPELTLM
ncbi:hypothetical protein NC997_12535 [Trichocoleus sp. DQ-A2]|nr:hypothetical protein [Coleofasciculus sp. FACHB-SPT36]